MGTDASEQMGFRVSFGNNVYINLETDSREETKPLFNALSTGGKVEMNYRICSGGTILEVVLTSMECSGW